MIRKNKKRVIRNIFVILLVVLITVFAAMPPVIMNDTINAHMDVEVIRPEEYDINAISLRLKTEDALSIAAWEVEVDKPKGIIILLSGIQNPSVTAFWGYSKMLKENGYASLLIEMRAHGDSEGDRVCLGYLEYLDVKAGVDYITGNPNYKDIPVIVWGTSMGGATAINSIGELEEIDGLISFSAYSSWPDVFCDNMVEMGAPSLLAVVEKPFVSVYIGLVFGFDKLRINPKEEIKKLKGRPALLAHSTDDSQIPYTSFERIFESAQEENIVTFIREGDEHFMVYEEYAKNPLDDKELSSVILNFLEDNYE